MGDEKKPPLVFVDTGTLLTLILGGDRNQQGNGYAELLKLMVEKGLVRLAITDMVAAEFLGMTAPIHEADLRGASPRVTSEHVYNQFRFAPQRINLLRELLSTGHFTIYNTACSNEYLHRVQRLLATSPDILNGQTEQFSDDTPDALEKLRVELMDNGGVLAGAVRNDRFTDKQGNPETAGFNDRGEVSIADAIKRVQSIEGKDTPVFIMYEGTDVRARIIQRLSIGDTKDPNYHQYGPVLKQFNPNRQAFADMEAAMRGNIRFVTTKAFLGSMMWAGKQMDETMARHAQPKGIWNRTLNLTKRKFHIVSPDELSTPEAFEEAYDTVFRHVKDNGLSRRYKKCRDVAISHRDFEAEKESSSTGVYFGERTAQEGSWQHFIEQCFEENREVLESVIRGFSEYRNQEHERTVRAQADEMLGAVRKMEPATAEAFLKAHIAQLKQEHDLAKRQR